MEKKYWALASNRDAAKILHDTPENLHSNQRFAWTSLSCRYNTKAELIKGEGILPEPCRECGTIVSTNYLEDTKQALIRQNICFTCNFWLRKVEIKDSKRVARINGTHYYIDDDKPGNVGLRGFGGAEFLIRFNNGRTVTTRNLWCQGDIPKALKDRLPDNAIFVIKNLSSDQMLNKAFPGLS